MTTTTAIDRGVLPTTEVVARVHHIQHVMQALMKEHVHYGTIPGTPKPTLYKPGAELLLMTFRIAAAPRHIDDLSTSDEVRYRVTMIGTNQLTGETLGEAIGECSSSENKYRWVKPVCDAEWDETDPTLRREKWMKGTAPYKVKQIRSSPADVANTILKMAAKRALVGLTLQCLAASDIFAQDIEDLDEQLREQLGEEPKKRALTPPQRKSDAKPGTTVQGKVQHIDEKTGKKGDKVWTKWGIKVDDKFHGTFDTKHRDTAKEAQAAGLDVRIEFKPSEFGRDIVTIEEVTPAEAQPAADGQLPMREPGEDG